MAKIWAVVGLMLGCVLSTGANAAFIYGVDATPGPTITPGTSGVITVFINNTGPAVGSADTFQVNLQVSAAGGANFAQLGLATTATNTGAISGPFNTQSTSGAGAFFVAGSRILNPGTPASIPLGRTNLFTIAYNVSAATPELGRFTFDIVQAVATTGGLNPSTSFALNGNNLLDANSFSAAPEFTLTVSSVPEPATLGFLGVGLIAAGTVVRRVRKRK